MSYAIKKDNHRVAKKLNYGLTVQMAKIFALSAECLTKKQLKNVWAKFFLAIILILND